MGACLQRPIKSDSMPPKVSSSTHSSKPPGPTKEQLEAINNYLAQKPDFDKLIAEAKANPQSPTKKTESDYERTLREAVRTTFEERRKEAETSRSQEVNMPVHPKEENTEGSEYLTRTICPFLSKLILDMIDLYDQVAKNFKDSTASSHPLHHREGGKASIDHHKATPGPVMAENLPEPASKEDLRKRAEELNKKS